VSANEEVTREDVLGLFYPAPTDPYSLKWDPLMGFMKGILRLRLNITPQNASPELVEACRLFVLPEEDLPEVKGLMRALGAACARAGLAHQFTKGPRGLQEGVVSAFEPYKLGLPFRRAELILAIGPGEFQWILKHANKERPPLSDRLEILKRGLLEEMRVWLRRGNR